MAVFVPCDHKLPEAYNSYLKFFLSYRTPFNFLLVNLAAADIFYPCFLLLQFIVMIRIRSVDEMPGNAICVFLSKTAWTGAFAGVFTMIIIARERYYTVVHPHGDKGKITARTLKVCHFDNMYVYVSLKVRLRKLTFTIGISYSSPELNLPPKTWVPAAYMKS